MTYNLYGISMKQYMYISEGTNAVVLSSAVSTNSDREQQMHTMLESCG
jgi:hypothetical protein